MILPSSGPDNYFYRVKSAALTEETPVLVHTAGISSGNTAAPAVAASAEQPFCSRNCLLILGPLSAGLIVVALIAGLVIARKRRQRADNMEFRSSGGFGIRRSSASASYKGKEKLADDDDLMMEMFEPPELSISPNPHIMEWRHTGGADPHASMQAAMGRNTMLGLSTIMEENMHDKARDKMYGNVRRKSSHKLTPVRLNSPRGLMRSDRSPMMTPPISPSLSSSAQGSPNMVPFPMGGADAAMANGPAAAAAAASSSSSAMLLSNQFLKPAPKKKRKLTIPYNPQDVTRRRSLEGAW